MSSNIFFGSDEVELLKELESGNFIDLSLGCISTKTMLNRLNL